MQNRWLPVVGGVMMNMALGTFYAMSAFMLPLEKEFGWTRAQTSWVTTIGLVLIAAWFVIAGFIQDRRGPKLVAAIGGTLFSLGLFLASFTQSLTMFYLTAGVITGTGSGFGYVVPTAVGAKWFPDKRGLVVGLMVGGYGAGSGVFGPIATSLVGRVGWRTTFQILAVLFFAMTMIATWLIRNPPAGYRPAGWDPNQARAASRPGADVHASAMVRTQTFWALWIAYCLGTTAGTMIISQLVPFARNAGHTAAVAAFALTVGAIGSASGRVLSGWMSDHAGRLNTLRLLLLVSALAMPALFLLRENLTLFYALLAVVYYCYGTQLSVYASTSADFYGTKNVGFNYGLLLLAWGVAGILGPFLGGRVYVATGEYRWAFFIAAGLSLAALATLFLARNPHAVKKEGVMRRTLMTIVCAGLMSVSFFAQGDGGYRLVPNWPKLPAGMYFGLKDAPPPPAERDAQAAARRARGSTGSPQAAGAGIGGGGGQQAAGGPTNQPGISGLAIDAQDRIYVFNRGVKPVMVFDREGNLILAGADQEINGKKINPSWQHSGGVDWDGNVYVIERDAHRIVKLSPKLDTFLMQLGTTNEKGNDATHLNLPSGIAILHNGNIIVTDGYGNNRVILFDKNGKFIKQVAKGEGGPADKGTGPGEWNLPHKLAVDADENLYIIDREGHRIEVFDKNLKYLRDIRNDWNPWDVCISRKGTDGIGFIADHKDERVQKFQLKDGKILATWGKQGWGPGEFDWVHGVVVDSKGAVYAADTYGQRLQKFVLSTTTTSQR